MSTEITDQIQKLIQTRITVVEMYPHGDTEHRDQVKLRLVPSIFREDRCQLLMNFLTIIHEVYREKMNVVSVSIGCISAGYQFIVNVHTQYIQLMARVVLAQSFIKTESEILSKYQNFETLFVNYDN